MGTLLYGATTAPIAMDDRTLAHLKVVITTKLRRRESFTLTWQDGTDDEPGRSSTLWLHPAIPLMFVFDDPAPADLDRRRIEQLAVAANSRSGIRLSSSVREGSPAAPATQQTRGGDA